MSKIVIVDIDGTLADTSHRMHLIRPPEGEKKKWHEFFMQGMMDPIFRHVSETVKALSNQGHRIVLLTGRPENYRKITESWLNLFKVKYDELYMRPSGRNEPDYLVKHELFWKICEGDKSKVLCVFEDRITVVKMWRALDVPVFICGNDVFENLKEEANGES